ncbi:MAG TPA: NAD(P)/FAD-dependent oxidoreductase [Pyrinomonadaceae bacterium]|nr:NAD(P)/FAD-dependent oxidoreductase [Pyrinomonadaceae bacterium]
MPDFDAIIIGGGPAGASAAIHLAARGARVLLAEQKKFPREKLCGEFISPECLEHFTRLGVLERMNEAGGARVSQTVFYAPSGRGLAVPSAWFGGGEGGALGLSRAEMDARLLARAKDAGVHVIEEASLACVVVEGGRVAGVRLHVAGEGVGEYRARITVDATGRQRVVARHAAPGEGRRARPSLVAFKAHLEGARGDARTCEIYFYRGGYGGLSPVEGGASNLCFIARARDVRERAGQAERVMREVLMRNRRAAGTLAEAHARTRWLAVSIESFGRRAPAPAVGLLAVGDAAAFIDPFTGSGMLMALESGELAARTVARWLDGPGRDSFDALAREYRAAYADRFDARLRLCSALRRAAFAPPQLAEVAVVALGASERLRRGLARATRRRALPGL